MPYKDPEKARESARRASKKYREKNPDHMRKWRAKNPEKSREVTRRWKAANPERAAEVARAAEQRRMADPVRWGKKLASAREYQKKYRAENLLKVKDRLLQKLYGITLKEREYLEREHAGRCAICGKQETASRRGVTVCLSVDHCAKTGVVRGLLCTTCNRGIGFFQHDPELFRSAIDYLLYPPAPHLLKRFRS